MKKLLVLLFTLFSISLYLAIFVFNETFRGCVRIGASVICASLVCALAYNLVFKNIKKSIVASFVIYYTTLVSEIVLAIFLFDYLKLYLSDSVGYFFAVALFIIHVLAVVLYYKKEYDWKKLVAVSILAMVIFYYSYEWFSGLFSKIIYMYTHANI